LNSYKTFSVFKMELFTTRKPELIVCFSKWFLIFLPKKTMKRQVIIEKI
jgi:hypothetical protein